MWEVRSALLRLSRIDALVCPQVRLGHPWTSLDIGESRTEILHRGVTAAVGGVPQSIAGPTRQQTLLSHGRSLLETRPRAR